MIKIKDAVISKSCDYVGNELQVKSVSSLRECVNECKNLADCKRFTFEINNKNCHLKNSDLLTAAYSNGTYCGKMNKDDDANDRMWISTCDTNDDEEVILELSGVDSVDLCANECVNQNNCTHFVYDGDSAACFLKNHQLFEPVYADNQNKYCGQVKRGILAFYFEKKVDKVYKKIKH